MKSQLTHLSHDNQRISDTNPIEHILLTMETENFGLRKHSEKAFLVY